MDNIQRDIVDLLLERAVSHKPLERAKANEIEKGIRAVFSDPRVKSGTLWETIDGCSFYEEAGRQQTRDMLSMRSQSVVLLIDDWHGYSAILISACSVLPDVLEYIYGFRWYVTDQDRTFLLCRNDHNFVIFAERKSNAELPALW